jgi:hypothetical protein
VQTQNLPKSSKPLGYCTLNFAPKKTTCLIILRRRAMAKIKLNKKLNPYLWEELEEGQKLQLIVGLIF